MLRIGHRGARGYAPENTLKSIQLALDMRCDAVEFDVRLCASGEVVVMHDAAVDRTTDGSGAVAKMSLVELKQLDAGGGEPVPTLEEALAAIDRQAIAFIEMKSDDCVQPVAAVIEDHVQHRGWDYEQFLVIAFNHHLLLGMHRIDPRIPTGALIEAIPITYAECGSQAKCRAINPCIGFLNAAFVADARARGLLVYPWTANSFEDIAHARALGVDGIASDYPDRI